MTSQHGDLGGTRSQHLPSDSANSANVSMSGLVCNSNSDIADHVTLSSSLEPSTERPATEPAPMPQDSDDFTTARHQISLMIANDQGRRILHEMLGDPVPTHSIPSEDPWEEFVTPHSNSSFVVPTAPRPRRPPTTESGWEFSSGQAFASPSPHLSTNTQTSARPSATTPTNSHSHHSSRTAPASGTNREPSSGQAITSSSPRLSTNAPAVSRSSTNIY